MNDEFEIEFQSKSVQKYPAYYQVRNLQGHTSLSSILEIRS